MREHLARFSKTGKQKSMKRKVALLLAFAMVLSILPMNVFGIGQAVPVINRPTDNYGRLDGQVVDWQISINVQDLRGQTAGTATTHLVLPVTLSGAGDGYVRFVNEIPESGHFTRLPLVDVGMVTSPWNHHDNRIDMRATNAGQIARDANAAINHAGTHGGWNGAGIQGQGAPGGQINSRLRTMGSTDDGQNFVVEFVRTGHQTGYLLLRFFGTPQMEVPTIPGATPTPGPDVPTPGPGTDPYSYTIHAFPSTLIPVGGLRFPHGTEISEGARFPATATQLAASGLVSGVDFRFEDAGIVTILRNAQVNGNALTITQDDALGALGTQFMGSYRLPRFHSQGANTNPSTLPDAAGPIPWELATQAAPLVPNLNRPANDPVEPGDAFLELNNPLNRRANRINAGVIGGVDQNILVTTGAALTAPVLGELLTVTPTPGPVVTDTIPLDATGQLRITMPPIRVRHTDARIRVNMHTSSGAVLVDRPLAAFPGTGIIVDTPTAVIFEHIAGLNNLVIREASAGNFNRVASGTDSANGTGYLAIRLLAPPNYFWGVPSTEHRGRGATDVANGPLPRVSQAVRSVDIGSNGQVYRTTFQHANGRHELTVIVPVTGRPNTAVAAVPAALRLEGLRLIPTEQAPREHNVNIDVSVARVRLDSGEGSSTLNFNGLPDSLRLEHFGNSYDNRLMWPTNNNYIHRASSVHVATRSQAELTLQTYGDEVEFRSGLQGEWMYDRQQYNGNQPGGRVTGAPGDYRVTQRLQLFENVPNALGLSPGAPVTFTFPQGVEILGAHYRIVNHANGNVINPWRTQWRNSVAGTTEWNQELSLSANTATFRHILDAVPAGGTLRRRIEVEFSLSVAPGFFAEHSDQVVVTVGGAGVNNLPTAARTLSIANVYDPIHVELLGGPLTFEAGETGRVHNLPGRVPIGDLLIAETAGGMLSMGETIIVYASGSFMPRAEDLAFHSGQARTDGSSGLSLSNPREIMVNVNGRLIRAVEFEVIGESSPDDDGGYITLTGNWIAGFVYPEEEYYIVVTGTAVGGTTQLMAAYRAEEQGGRNTRAAEEGRSVGMFNMRPYGVRFIDFIAGGPDVGLPGLGTGTGQFQPPHLPSEIRILTTDPFTTTRDDGAHTINPPVVFREFPSVNPAISGGPTTSVGFVSLRVFADIAGAEVLENYPGAGEVTIRGLHSDGQRTVTVTVRTGNRFIGVYVSGGTHRAWDIAEFSGHLTNVPYGQIATINYQDRLYLPFRAVANAFGYDLRVEGPVVIFG